MYPLGQTFNRAIVDGLVHKGVIDCSGNPNYPAADTGHLYVVSVAGKIGGASGVLVDAGDMFICNTDGTVSGNQATVGTKWNILERAAEFVERAETFRNEVFARIDHGDLIGLSDDDHPQYIKHSLATAISDFLVATGAGAFVKKTLAEVKTILGIPYVHPNHSGEVTSAGDGAQTIANNAVTLAKLATQAADTILANATAGAAVPTAVPVAEQTLVGRITGGRVDDLSVTEVLALLNAAAQAFLSTIGQTVTSSGPGATLNQIGTGDIVAFQDAGSPTVRVPDQGGIALVPQAGGYQNIAGLLGYDSVKRRMVLYHESHNFPVPIDPRNSLRQVRFDITYA